MRAWHGVPPERLCATHLAREWNELRQVCAVARGEWAFGDEWHYRKLRGHVSRGQLLPGYLRDRLDALAAELARRGRCVPVVPTVPDYLHRVDHERLRPADVRQHNRARLARKAAGQTCDCAPRDGDGGTDAKGTHPAGGKIFS